MTTTIPTAAPKPIDRPRGQTVALVAAGAAVAVAANAAIAAAAIAAGADPAFSPLLLPVYGAFSILGVVASVVGWRIVRRRATNSAQTLSVLVPVLALLSYVPDVALLVLGFIPGSSTTAVVALMLMHLVVLGIAVPLSARLAPVR